MQSFIRNLKNKVKYVLIHLSDYETCGTHCNGNCRTVTTYKQMLDDIFDRQDAGFEECFRTLGITDDRDRNWSSLVLAIQREIDRKHPSCW